MPTEGLKRDLAAIAVLAALALVFFWPVTMGGRTMLPADSVYAWEPWKSSAPDAVGVAHNSLVLDLYLQNYAWKSFIVDSLRAGDLPLWNPYILSGVPFLAGGQHSAMYPLSAVFYVLPVEAAYGWFAALHLFLAGAWTYVLARTLRVSRGGALIAGTAFMFGGFMVIRNVFPMIVAAAVWLPLILAVVEAVVRRAEEGRLTALGAVPSLGAAQWLPLLDLVRHNFREGSASFAEVLGWAYPPRRVIALLIPDFFGNPTHHAYLDLFSWQRVAVTVNALGERIDTIYWGMKNYVEGAAYVGVLPLFLAAIGVLRRHGERRGFFLGLAALSLAFAFGSRLYWLVFRLPGLNQVHSPFRWVYLYTLSVALLAGMGADALWRRAAAGGGWRGVLDRIAGRALPAAALGGGVAVWAGLGLSLLAKERVAALAERALHALARAPEAFADGRMFYSYEFRNVLLFGAGLLAAGAILWFRPRFARRGVWTALAVSVVFGELYAIGSGFLPRVERSLIAQRPPVVDFLRADGDLFRVTTYVGGSEKTFNANAGMLYGLQDVRGYDSIIPRQYVDYMALISEQSELPYNRIAPLFDWQPEALDSRLLDLLNVRYVLASRERPIDRPGYELVYDGRCSSTATGTPSRAPASSAAPR